MRRSWLAALRDGFLRGQQSRTRRRQRLAGGVQDLLSGGISRIVEHLEARTLLSVVNSTGTITITEGSGNNTVQIGLDATGQNLQIYENTSATGTPTLQTAASGVSLIVMTGNTGNDQLILDYSHGSPTPFETLLTFDGGTGTNTLVLQGGSIIGPEAVTSSASDSGIIDLEGGAISYHGVATIDDTVAASDVSWRGSSSAETIAFGNGATIGGTQTTAITTTGSPTTVPYNFANKSLVIVDGNGGGDTFNINNSTPAVGLTHANFYGSNATDTFNVTPSATVLYNVNGAYGLSSTTGSDVLNLNFAGATNAQQTASYLNGVYIGSVNFDNREPVGFAYVDSITPSTNLQQSSLSAPATAVQGAIVTYALTVGNSGQDAAPNLTLTDVIPVGMTFVSANFTSGTGSFTNGTLTWNAGTIAVNAAVSGSIKLRATATGSITNTVSFASDSIQGGASSLSAATTITPAPPAPIITQGIALTASMLVPTGNQTLATFTDAASGVTASGFSATINWGDGSSSSTGTISLANGVFAITGPSHTYATAGSFVRIITLLQSSTLVATITDTVVVTDPPIVGTASSLNTVQFAGLSNAVVATFQHGANTQSPGSYYALIRWGDGAITAGTITLSGGSYTVTGSHTYNTAGAFAVVVTISEGQISGQISSSVSVTPGGTDNQRFVAAVYRALLHREVDSFALSAWSGLISSGTSRTAVVQYIENSSEYQTGVIQNIYQTYLGRTLSGGALAGPLAFMQSGGTAEQLTASLIGSQEYFVNRGGNTNAGFVTAVYHDLLHRTPDSAGLTAWTNALVGGLTPLQLATGFLASTEYQSVLIRGYYTTYLGHAANQPAVDYWVGVLRQSGRDDQVIASILGSTEYFQRVT